jgi:hypothetical protein
MYRRVKNARIPDGIATSGTRSGERSDIAYFVV